MDALDAERKVPTPGHACNQERLARRQHSWLPLFGSGGGRGSRSGPALPSPREYVLRHTVAPR